MTSIVKAASAAQFLALVPRLAGYRPSESLVLVPFVGTRTAGVMRVDLPVGADADEVERCAATFLGMVCRLPQVDGLAAVVYTEDAFGATGMPHRALLDALATRADAAGLRVTDALCVGTDGWGSAFDRDCPVGGWSLDDIVEAEATLPDIPAPVGDQATGARLPRVDFAVKERVARALGQLEAAVVELFESDAAGGGAASGRVDPQALAAVDALEDAPALFEEAVESDPSTAHAFDLAVIAWCLSRPALRDVALVQWCGSVHDGDAALDAQARWESGEAYPPHIAQRLWGAGASPDADRLAAALEVARHAAAAAPEDLRAGALASCAWLSWALGRSTHAAAYAELAFGSEPDHGLAGIVLTMVNAGHLPEWAFATRHARPASGEVVTGGRTT